MKNMFESGEIFEAYARIDLRYYGLKQLYDDMNKPKSGLDLLIDRQTGYGEFKTKEYIRTAIDLIAGVIEDKKIIQADYSADEKILQQLKCNELLNSEQEDKRSVATMPNSSNADDKQK